MCGWLGMYALPSQCVPVASITFPRPFAQQEVKGGLDIVYLYRSRISLVCLLGPRQSLEKLLQIRSVIRCQLGLDFIHIWPSARGVRFFLRLF